MEPFGVTSDPRFYVPRLGSEAALTALREGFAAGKRISVLTGPPGLGKTMVLHVFAQSLTNARPKFLPYPALEPEELAVFALAPERGEEGESALAALARAAKREPERPLVLLIDDASALPVASSRALRQLADDLGGSVRIVVAITDEARSSATIAALGDGLHHVRLKQPMLAREVGVYVRKRLSLAGQRADALHEQQVAWLAEESGGVPRVVNSLAAGLLRAPVALGSDGVEAFAREGAARGESGARLRRGTIAGASSARAQSGAAAARHALDTAPPQRGILAWLRSLLRFGRH